MDNNSLKVASVQMVSYLGDVLKNREIIKKYIVEAASQAVDILITPELANVGYDLKKILTLDYNYQEELDFYSKLAQQYKITLSLGMLEKEGSQFYNSLITIDTDGQLISKYRKINLFPIGREKELFKSGTQPGFLTLGQFKIGLSICYDIRFPELFRYYVENDCNVIFVSSAFPFPRLEHWQILLKAHAIMNQSYLIASNRVGTDNKIQFVGNSCIIDPWGIVLSSLDDKQEGLLVETLDLVRLQEERNKIPALADRKSNFPLS